MNIIIMNLNKIIEIINRIETKYKIKYTFNRNICKIRGFVRTNFLN